jgi:hypothetical protein
MLNVNAAAPTAFPDVYASFSDFGSAVRVMRFPREMWRANRPRCYLKYKEVLLHATYVA